MTMTSGWGLQQSPTSPITKKYSTLKIKNKTTRTKAFPWQNPLDSNLLGRKFP